MSETDANGQLPSEETESNWKDEGTIPKKDQGDSPTVGSDDEDAEDKEDEEELEADGPVREDPEPMDH